jgi:hypothetical protein
MEPATVSAHCLKVGDRLRLCDDNVSFTVKRIGCVVVSPTYEREALQEETLRNLNVDALCLGLTKSRQSVTFVRIQRANKIYFRTLTPKQLALIPRGLEDSSTTVELDGETYDLMQPTYNAKKRKTCDIKQHTAMTLKIELTRSTTSNNGADEFESLLEFVKKYITPETDTLEASVDTKQHLSLRKS